MTRRWAQLLIAGIFVLLVSVLINFPASVVTGWLKRNSSVPMEWQQVDGSIFDANVIGLSVTTNHGRIINLDRLSFSTSKLSILAGKVSTEFKIWKNNSWISGKGIISLHDWMLSEAIGEILVSDLIQVIPELELFGISGIIKLEGVNLSGDVNQLPNSGNFTLVVSDLTSAMFKLPDPIGSYRLSDDKINDEYINASVVNIASNNQVFINAKINFSKIDSILRLNGYSWLSENADPSLDDLLLLMGRLENNRAIINWEWRPGI